MLECLSFFGVLAVTSGWLLGISYVDYLVAQYRRAQRSHNQPSSQPPLAIEQLLRLPWNWLFWGISGGVVFIVALISALIHFWMLMLLSLVGTVAIAAMVMSDMQQMQNAPAPSPGSMMVSASLYGVNGEYRGRSVQLNGYEGYKLAIGRSVKNNLRLADTSVSREHAALCFSHGRWFLQDLKSTGGTFVNGQRINASVLNDGDQLKIGATEFEVRLG